MQAGTNIFSQSFAANRTEDDILDQAAIGLVLGKHEYPVKPLTIRKGKEWRGKVAELLNTLSAGPLGQQAATPQGFMSGLMVAFFSFPDRVLDLLYDYSPELRAHRAAIEDSATDEEVVVAFSRVMAVAYPFMPLLGTMTAAAAMSQTATRRQ